MIILIAESKTMEREELEISPEVYVENMPVGELAAGEVMMNIREMSVSEIVATVKISHDMALRLKKMAYEFPDKSHGMRAIEAYTGVVFRNLDYKTLSASEKDRAQRKVRIISSLYGWLRPEDVVKPYRLEYTTPVSPDDTTLCNYWRGKVTIELVRYLQANGETEILHLLPADAAKCIDWKLVKRFAKVWKVDFKELNGETVKSPHAGKLKSLRGELLRNILTGGLATAGEVKAFSNDTMFPISDYVYPDRIAFYV